MLEARYAWKFHKSEQIKQKGFVIIFVDKTKTRKNTFREMDCSFRAVMTSGVALSLKTSFHDTVTPLVTPPVVGSLPQKAKTVKTCATSMAVAN